MTDRTCGGCTACCFTHQIRDINKPMGTWCTHCKVGSGCEIYDTKPPACTNYRCAWLKGLGTEDDRPDKVNAVLDFVVWDRKRDPQELEVVEMIEGASRQKGLQAIIKDQLNKGLEVFISVSGKMKDGVLIRPDGRPLSRYMRRILKSKKVTPLTATEYAAQQNTPAE